MGEHQQREDRFYEENKYSIAPEQYKAANKDFEYFIRRIELTVEYHKEG